MKIGSIGNFEDNPFLKSIEDLVPNQNNIEHGIQPKEDIDNVKLHGVEAGAGSQNQNFENKNLIDRSQFTNENDMQEINLDDFIDDFK